MKRLFSFLLALLLTLISVAVPAAPSVSQQVGERIGSVVYDVTHKDEFSPFEQKTGPPTLALSATQHFRPRWVFTQNNPSFVDTLQTSLVPDFAFGSGTPTFTRASRAYQTDFEVKQNLVLSGEARFQGARRVANLLVTTSENFSNAAWQSAGSGATRTASIDDPNGGTTAYRLTASGADGGVFNQYTSVTGDTYVQSMWLRRNSGIGAVYLRTVNNANVDISSVLTTSWQRFSSGPVAATGTTGIFALVIHTSGDKVDVWHPLAQDATGQANQNPSEYVSVGVLSAPYQGAGVDGVQYFNYLNGNTVASNVVTEAQGLPIVAGQSGVSASAPVDAKGPLGEIDEPSYQNLLGTTAAIVRTMTDVGWVATNMTVATTVGVDGVTASGARLTATGANATILFTPGLLAGIRTYLPFIKRITGTGTVSTTGDVADGYVAQTITTAYASYPLVTTSAVPVVGYKLATSGDVIDVDFNVLVAGSIAPAVPIPVNVTTAADVKQYVSSGNISSTMSGTMQITPAVALGSAVVFHFATYVDANNYTAVLSNGTNLIARKRIGGTSHDATIAWTRTVGTVAKVGWRFDTVNGSDIFLNGTKGTVDATLTAAQIGTNFQIGADGNGANQDSCEHRIFNAYPTALSAPYLQNLTTDATDFLGDPMWRYAANDDYYRKVANQ